MMITYNLVQAPFINERQLLRPVNHETLKLPVYLSEVGRVVGHEICAAPRTVVQVRIE